MTGTTTPTVRKVAAIVVAAGATAAALAPVLWVGGKRGPGPQEPPWPLPAVPAQWESGAPWSSGADLIGPAALIYVDRECIHCKAELQRWDALVSEQEPDIQLWVVASPKSVMDGAAWVPPSLRRHTVKDGDGTLGRALGVNAVPVTFWIDAADTVRVIGVGQSTRQGLIDNILGISLTRGEQ